MEPNTKLPEVGFDLHAAHKRMIENHKEARERRRKQHRRPHTDRREKYCGNLY